MTTTNGVASWRLMSDKIDGFDLSPADSEEVHVLAVDDSLIDRKTSDNNSSSSSSSVIAFPKLTSPMINYMEKLEEWDYGIAGMGNTFIMPGLSDLSISSRSKLKALPDRFDQSTTLKELCISWGFHILNKRYRKGQRRRLA
ncbi:hypothetical protein WN944_006013 [Citrus x changshan-huyou]|uniref:Uncharacterized protein n=1 Tax=Citrus x changshan-huyou TaxID=2935761 RepID=A0AAP0ML08_9ROSI